jgi:sulfate adenylyltransferase
MAVQRVAVHEQIVDIAPHGGELIQRVVDPLRAQELCREAREAPAIRLTARQLSDLNLLSHGALSPLEGFMASADYECVVTEMHLASGLAGSVPVTLAVDSQDAPREGSRVELYDTTDQLVGMMDVWDVYGYDKRREAREVYRTEDESHPGVVAVYAQGDTLLGGPVWILPDTLPQGSRELHPDETRREFAARDWRNVVGFQTRNPVHRAHEYIQKCALEIVDGLLLHPLVGQTKSDDIPADVRMRCYEVLLANYYPQNRVLLATLPAAMRYAGPREAIFHALMRKNYGCTHFIVGRDHAGVGSYYGTYDAQAIFEQFAPGELGIQPLKFENSFFCRRCNGMASEKTCPHDDAERVPLSGTTVRNMLRAGQLPPPEFSRPEVAQILIEAMRDAD